MRLEHKGLAAELVAFHYIWPLRQIPDSAIEDAIRSMTLAGCGLDRCKVVIVRRHAVIEVEMFCAGIFNDIAKGRKGTGGQRFCRDDQALFITLPDHQ